MLHHKRLGILFCILFPLQIFAQDITGLWKGVVYNDTTQKTLRYEIAISKEGKKLTGYSYTFFIYEDKVYQGLKKVKIKKVDDKIIIEDDGLIAHNYPIPPNKGVRQLNVLTLSIEDSVMRMSGPFTTNRTKEYHRLTGTVEVKRRNDFYKQSALIPHLEELGLAKNLSFIQEEEEKINAIAALQNTKIDVAKVDSRKENTSTTIASKTAPNVEVTPIDGSSPITAMDKKVVEIAKNELKKSTATPIINKRQAIPITTPAIKSNVLPAADLANRKVETIQSVYYKSDSLEITLYDNGEVDGDTVSVIMNGTIIMPKVGLSTNAVRKKISTANTGDSIQLIMYAETLGSLPPNTGLLIVYDGAERYEIRFSGDMQKSSAIVFRRKQ
jgi:archaellum component FlaF (FlaF/FlaG flagellin family)